MTARDRSTGQFKHEWGVVAQDAETGREIAVCDHCQQVYAYGGGRPEVVYSSERRARKAGEPVDAGMIPTRKVDE